MLADAYLPHDPLLVLWITVGLLIDLILGFGLSRLATTRPRLARWGSWLLVCGGFGLSSLVCLQEPPGFAMLAIIGFVLFSMKAVVSVEVVLAGGPQLSLRQWFSWAGAWPGMAPELFSTAIKPGPALPGADDILNTRTFLVRGLVRIAIGAVLLVLARLGWELTGSVVLATVCALPGLSLILHFGIFNLIAGFWRAAGVPTYSLFPAPLYARSLREFWGRRWNLPFTEMIQRAIYRPLCGPLGRQRAAVAGFLCSGLLHECAISYPVQKGFGLPMLYFVLHGGLVLIERTPTMRNVLETRPIIGHLWTIGWLVLPMPILFHPPFLRGVVWPLIGIQGG